MTARLYGGRHTKDKLLPSSSELHSSGPSPKAEWWWQFGKTKDLLQISRPNTRSESPGEHIFQLQDNTTDNLLGIVGSKVLRKNSLTTSNLLRVENKTPTLVNTHSFDDSLSNLRSQVNGHSQSRENQSRKGSRSSVENGFERFQFPDDIHHDRLHTGDGRSLYVSGTSFLKSDDSRYFNGPSSKGNTPRIGLNGHGTDLEDDITEMAAQRDQQRGTTRLNRGMMAPVIRKEEDVKKLSVTGRPNLMRQKGDYVDYSASISPEFGTRSSFSDSSQEGGNTNFGQTLVIKKLRDYNDDRGPKKRQPMYDPMSDLNSQDIMAQSIRRHTMKGRLSSFDSQENDDNVLHCRSRLSTGSIGTKTLNDFTILRSENDHRDHERRSTSFSEQVIPRSTEDVQILNLHGYMDSALKGSSAVKHDRMKKHRRQLRLILDVTPDDTGRKSHSRFGREKGRRRRDKNNGHRLSTAEGKEDEVVLKDIDDLDDNLSNLVIGPKQPFKETVGRPITSEEVQHLRVLLTGNVAIPLSKEWLGQSFIQNQHSNLSYGLIQKKGGPCGVLAAVQAHMMKSLIFGSRLTPTISPASPLRPSTREWSWALSIAITEILLRIWDSHKALILALPGSFSHFNDHGIVRYVPDGLTETITVYEFNSENALLEAVESHLQVFMSSAGCVLLLYSCLLTRGLDRVSIDMDAGGNSLINSFGYASQEVVNLLLTGQATTNTFDGDQTFDENGLQSQRKESRDLSRINSVEGVEPPKTGSSDCKMVLRGIRQRSEIGLLSLFEHYGSCNVGSHLKSPDFPVWVICSESHYSVLFARDQNIASNEFPFDPFDVYYYDGLALQEDEIKLTIDARKEAVDADLIAPLELCIRTKWPKAFISWNGTDPIL